MNTYLNQTLSSTCSNLHSYNYKNTRIELNDNKAKVEPYLLILIDCSYVACNIILQS